MITRPKITISVWVIRIILVISFFPLSASNNDIVFHKPPDRGTVGEDLELTVSLLVDVSMAEVTLYFREAGKMSYQEIIMVYHSGVWGAVIPGDQLSVNGLEYVIVLKTPFSGTYATPTETPFDTPHFVTIQPPSTYGRRFPGSELVSPGKMVAADILILSPEPGELVRIGETVIAASLFNTPNIDTATVRVFVDEEEYTAETRVEEGIINLVPGQLEIGLHTITLRMNTIYGLTVEPVKWSFSVVKSGFNVSDQIVYSGDISSRASNENVSNRTLNISEVIGNLDAGMTWITLKSNFRLTSRESPYQQHFNRLSGVVKLGNYVTVRMGDFNPSLSPFTIDGKRVRGIGVDINLPWIRFKAVRGELNRAVQWLGRKNEGYVLLAGETFVDSLKQANYTLDRRGYTFKRTIDAYRLTIDLRSKLLLGIHFLKSKDEVQTIDKFVANRATFSVESLDSLGLPDSLRDELTDIPTGIYTYSQFLARVNSAGYLIDFPERGWGGGDPEDNLVIGFDIGSTFDKRKLVFEFSWNFSLYNRNIWDGAMTRAQMDTTLDDSLDGFIGVQYDEYGMVTGDPLYIDTTAILDPTEYEDLFTINAFMTPLVPFDFAAFGDHPIASVVNMPSSAFHIKLTGHYYRSNFIVEYRQIGPEFVSLGNPYLTRNIREFILSDRLALLENKLLLNASYKHRDNKILRTTVDPLSTNTFAASITLVPGPDVASIMFNIQSIGKSNEIDTVAAGNRDLRENSRTINSLVSINFPFSVKDMKHNLVINYNTVINSDLLAEERRKDFLFQKTDTKAYSLNFSSRFVMPLRTIVSINRTELFLPVLDEDNTISKKPYSWTALGLNAHYMLFNNKLRLMAGLSYLNSKGNVESSLYGIKIGSEYEIMDDLLITLSGNLQLNEVPAYSNDSQDNDDDGKSDEAFESWSINTSGLLITLKYRF